MSREAVERIPRSLELDPQAIKVRPHSLFYKIQLLPCPVKQVATGPRMKWASHASLPLALTLSAFGIIHFFGLIFILQDLLRHL